MLPGESSLLRLLFFDFLVLLDLIDLVMWAIVVRCLVERSVGLLRCLYLFFVLVCLLFVTSSNTEAILCQKQKADFYWKWHFVTTTVKQPLPTTFHMEFPEIQQSQTTGKPPSWKIIQQCRLWTMTLSQNVCVISENAMPRSKRNPSQHQFRRVLPIPGLLYKPRVFASNNHAQQQNKKLTKQRPKVDISINKQAVLYIKLHEHKHNNEPIEIWRRFFH